MDNLWIWLVVEPYPDEKYEFVNWDDDIPNRREKQKNGPNHQPDNVLTRCILMRINRSMNHWFIPSDFMVKPGVVNQAIGIHIMSTPDDFLPWLINCSGSPKQFQ